MEDNLDPSALTPLEKKAQRERTLKLITVLFMVAILMLFIGLISAVVVSKMDKFWVNLKLPSAFTISTIVIILSSITLYLGMFFAKKNNQTLIKVFVTLSLLLGMGFIYYQVSGWAQLVRSGNLVTGGIYFQKGAYGEKFAIMKGEYPVEFDGNLYTYQGDTLSEQEENQLRDFIYPICKEDRKFIPRNYDLKQYGNPYCLGAKNYSDLKFTPLEFRDSVLLLNNVKLATDAKSTLFAFAFGIKNRTPYFGMRGTYGEDFTISLNGQELDFIDRKLFFPTVQIGEEEIQKIEAKQYQGGKEYIIKNGKVMEGGTEVQPNEFYFTDNLSQKNVFIDQGKWYYMGEELTDGQYNEFYQANNIASSYIYVLSVLHALHILIGFGLLVVLLVRTQKGYYHSEHYVGLKIGGYFWHFLGILWIALYIFWSAVTI